MLDTDFKPLNKRLKKQRTVLKSICDIIFQALKQSEVTVHSLDSSQQETQKEQVTAIH